MYKDRLKNVIEELTEIYEDEKTTVTHLDHSIFASTCSECEGYGDNNFDNITIVTEYKDAKRK